MPEMKLVYKHLQMTFKEFKTYIRKKIGLVGSAEFVENPIEANSKSGWEKWFSNDKFLKEYTHSDRLKSFQELVRILNEYAVFKGSQNLIDFGCGTGHLLAEIHKQYPEISLTGCDFSEESIRISRQLLPGVNFQVADIYNIPEEMQNQFDIVINTEVLEHLAHPSSALKNLLKLLKNGKGILILGVPNGRMDTYEGHINFWSPESWEVFIRESVPEMTKMETRLSNNRKNILSVIYTIDK